VYTREVVIRAVELSSSALILVHNHPSGDPTPSEEDVEMTFAIKRALATVNVLLHDHIIIGRGGWKSLSGEGLL
jgi:DNA repair protein RadC